MRKTVKIACLLLVALMLSLSLAGCAAHLPKYGYTNDDPISEDVNDFTNADDMVIDGNKDERYGTESVFRLYHKNNPESKVYVDSYLYFGKSGIHCFVSVTDNILSYHHLRAVYYNSSVELFFNSERNTDGSDKIAIDNRTCQYRIDCGGKYTKLCGVGGLNTYVSSYFDGQFAVKLRGNINSSDAEGFDVEVFIPWYELGFTADEQGNYNVDKLMYNVAYNHKTDPTGNENDTTRGRTMKTLSFQATPYTWVPLAKGDNGVAVNITSKDGALFGELLVQEGSLKGIYYPSYGFDLTNDTEIKSNIFLNTVSGTGYSFVKNGGDTEYYFECFMTGLENNDSSTSPKAGITQFFDGNRITLYVKAFHDGQPCENRLGVVQRNSKNDAWNWTDNTVWCPVTNKENLNSEDKFVTDGVKLAVYRKNDVMCFFVNDRLYFATDEARALGAEPLVTAQLALHDVYTEYDGERFFSDSYVGVYSYGAKVDYSDCVYKYGEEAFSELEDLVGMGTYFAHAER